MNNQKEGETVSGTERKQKFVLSDIFFMHVQYFALINLKLRLQLQFSLLLILLGPGLVLSAAVGNIYLRYL